MALVIGFAPLASSPMVQPAQAHVSELDAILRLVPAVLAAVGGWQLGGPLGMVGKVLGAYVGYRIGSWVGGTLSRTIGGVFHDSYDYQPPLWQRLLGIGGASYSQPQPIYTGYGGGIPYAPTDSLGRLRQTWLDATEAYQTTLASGDQAAKEAARAAFESAQRAYFAAKSDG